MIEYCTYHALSLLIHALARIVEKITLISDITMLNSEKDGYVPDKEKYGSYKPENSRPI